MSQSCAHFPRASLRSSRNTTRIESVVSPCLAPKSPFLRESSTSPPRNHKFYDLTCKRGSGGQSEGLLVPGSSLRFHLNPENSNSYGFELYRPSIKGTKLLLKVIKAIIFINIFMPAYFHVHAEIDSVESMTMTLHASLARDAEHCNIGIKMDQWLTVQCSI